MLLLRVAGHFRARDGHIDNITGERQSQNPNARFDGSDLQGGETFATRASLTYSPTDRLSTTLILNYQQDDAMVVSTVPMFARAFDASNAQVER